jgi:hypothetical protein
MVTSRQALKKYGNPRLLENQSRHLTVWQVPADIRTPLMHVRFIAKGTIEFPKKIFVNNDFLPVLEKSLRNVIDRGFANEMKTWDGCFIIRNKINLQSLSLHSWGLAVDINAFENQLGQKPKLSAGFAKCFTDAGCDWGGHWDGKRIDGMHFQLAKI